MKWLFTVLALAVTPQAHAVDEFEFFNSLASNTAIDLPDDPPEEEFLDAARLEFYAALGASETFEALRTGTWAKYLERVDSSLSLDSYMGYVVFMNSVGFPDAVGPRISNDNRTQALGIAAASVALATGAPVYLGLKETHYFDRSSYDQRVILRELYHKIFPDAPARARGILAFTAAFSTTEMGFSPSTDRVRGAKLQWSGNRVISFHALVEVVKGLLEIAKFNLLPDFDKLSQRATRAERTHITQELQLSLQYYMMAGRPRALTHIDVLAHDLTAHYHAYGQTLLAPVFERYIRWLDRVHETKDPQKQAHVLRESDSLHLQDGIRILDQVHVAFGKGLQDLRFIAMIAADGAGLQNELGPILDRFLLNTHARQYELAESTLKLSETLFERKPDLANSRARAALKILMRELLDIEQKMIFADKMKEVFK